MPSTENPRRRWQFSLKTMLALTAVAAVVLGTQFYREPLTPENLQHVRELTSIDKDVWKLAWSPDGLRVALVEWEKPVEVRDTVAFLKLDEIGAGKRIIHFAFSSRPDLFAFCENGANVVEVVDRQAGSTITLATNDAQAGMAFSPDDRLLVTGGYGTAAKLWDVSTGKLVREFSVGETEGGLTPVFSRDGKTLAVGNRNATTWLFNVDDGQALHELPRASSHELKFSPDGKRLAVAYVDGSVALWDVSSGKLIASVATGADEIYTLDWSRDGRMLAAAGLKGAIYLFDGRSLAALRQLPAPEWVISVKFTPDGTRLITTGGAQVSGQGPRSLQVWGVIPPWRRWWERAFGRPSG